jgi:uncharacterized protein (TIGR00725 family)
MHLSTKVSALPRRRIQVAVIGSATPSEQAYQTAYDVGRLLAEAEVIVVCGGLGGVMEAASRGATDAGGIAIGVVPGDRGDANEWLSAVVSPGMGLARNYILINSADGVIAVEGQTGTLSELCYASQRGLPVAGVGTWRLSQLNIHHHEDAQQAVSWLLEMIDG